MHGISAELEAGGCRTDGSLAASVNKSHNRCFHSLSRIANVTHFPEFRHHGNF